MLHRIHTKISKSKVAERKEQLPAKQLHLLKWRTLLLFGDGQYAVTKRLVGWSLAESLEADLMISALRKSSLKRLIKAGANIYSDRGSQYASNKFRLLLRSEGLLQSMSIKGNCYDNARAESLFSRFKTECLKTSKKRRHKSPATSKISTTTEDYNPVWTNKALWNMKQN